MRRLHMLYDIHMDMSRPLYRQLADEIATQIANGILQGGERLTSLRALSTQRGLSLSTVQEAFRVLEDQALVEARPQSGYFVRRQAPHKPSMPASAPAEIAVDPLLWSYIHERPEHGITGFRSASPHPDLLPIAQIQKLMASCIRHHPEMLSDYGCPGGDEEFKRQIVRKALEWGGHLEPENLVVTQGTIEALNLALRALTQPGDVVAVESPTYFALLSCLKTLGLRVIEIPTDWETGISVEALELATRNGAVQAVILSANFSNPLGALMPEHAKQRVAQLLASRQIPLIEDDVYGEFYFGKHRPRPIKAYDDCGNILYCSSLTKNVAPGLRVGWIEAGRYRAQVEMQKYIGSHSTPRIHQAVLAQFLANGGYARHMRQFRRQLALHIDAVIDGVARYFPAHTRVTRPQGGFVLWLELEPAFDSVALFHRAKQEDISIAPGPLFSARGAYRHCLRLSCAVPWNQAQEAKLARLGALACDLSPLTHSTARAPTFTSNK